MHASRFFFLLRSASACAVPTPGWAPIVFRTVANLPSGTEMRKFAVETAAEAILGSASYAPLNFDAFWAEHDNLLIMTAVPVPSAGDGNDSEVSSLKLAVQGVVDYILCEVGWPRACDSRGDEREVGGGRCGIGDCDLVCW